MNRKERMDLLLSKVEESKKEALIAALREAGTKEERIAAARKFGVELTAEETQALKAGAGSEISDEELDKAAGGCCSKCGCYCGCG